MEARIESISRARCGSTGSYDCTVTLISENGRWIHELWIQNPHGNIVEADNRRSPPLHGKSRSVSSAALRHGAKL
jgi:hypothetical protein